MSHLPEFRPIPLAQPGTLTSDLLAGATGVELPLIGAASSFRPPSTGRTGKLDVSVFGASSTAAEAKLEAILAGPGHLVTTGQQPLLFLGPLFVLYKALTAIELARRVEANTGAPALAMFWIASDDHDWDEVGSASILDASGELRRMSLAPPEGRAGRSVGATSVDSSIMPLIDELAQSFPNSEFAPAYLKQIRDAYKDGRRLGEAFASGLAQVLEAFDFVWLDSSDSAVKRASVPLARRFIEERGVAEAALSEGARRLRDSGHEAPIPVLSGASPLFLDTDERRERLYRTGGGFRLGKKGKNVTEGELIARLEEAPERFSPNVASRPLLESWLLPVTATVLGPGEIAYWSQLPPLFDRYDVPMPSIRPRAAWTLVESKIARLLDRLDATPDDLADGGKVLTARITRDSRPTAVDAALTGLREQIGPGLDALEGAVGEELPGIRSAVGKARKQVQAALDALRGRIDAGVRERETSRLQSVRKCAAHLFPDGNPQERSVNPYYYLVRYGPELITELSIRTRAAVEEESSG